MLRNIQFYLNLPVKIHPFPPGMGRAFNRLPPLAKRYVRFLQAIHHYDVWIIIGAYPNAYIASSLAGAVPLILRTYGRDIQIDNEIGHGTRRDPKVDDRTIYAVNKMDRVIAMTKTIHTEYLDMGVAESNIVDIPNGVDVSRFQSMRSDTRHIRKTYGVPDDSLFILTVGRNDPKKNFIAIPSIAKTLERRGIRFDWRIVGRDTDKLDSSLREVGASDSVRTIPEMGHSMTSNASGGFPQIPGDDLVALFQAADVFVFPSKLELFPQVVIQAMAAGLPAVVADAPGCHDVAEHNVSGLLTPPEDAEQFANYVALVATDDALRKRLTEGGLHKAEESDWSRVTSAYEDICYSLVKERRCPNP